MTDQNFTLKECAQLLLTKKISSHELVQLFLDKIKILEPKLNSFISLINPADLLEQARLSDQRRAQNNLNNLNKNLVLDGIPMAQKDLFCTQGIKTSCGSKMLDNFIAPYDAEIVSRCKQAGLITLGKTNMDEFAMGSCGENSFYGPSKNPWNLDYTPGGSSSGSAAAVAAGLVPVATGSDTGGSIRQPASFSGITGLKPTYGRVSRYGMVAFASSLDQAGPMARTAEDCALLLNILAGHDPKDSTSSTQNTEDYTAALNHSLKNKKIGLPKQFFGPGINPEVSQKIADSLKIFEKLGCEIIDIDLPHNDLAISAYYLIAPAEASSNLSRFDGVRFGYRCENPKDLKDLYERSRAEGFGEEVKRRILIGTYVLSQGYFEAYYLKAQKIRRLIYEDFSKVFSQVDLIMGPTCPSPAFKIFEKSHDPLALYQSDANTVAVNLAGLPGISIPVGFSQDLKLPIGLQIIGPHFSESLLLNAAHQFQLETDFHLATPVFLK